MLLKFEKNRGVAKPGKAVDFGSTSVGSNPTTPIFFIYLYLCKFQQYVIVLIIQVLLKLK